MIYFSEKSQKREAGHEGYCIIWANKQVCHAVKGMVFKPFSLRQGSEIGELRSRKGYHFLGKKQKN